MGTAYLKVTKTSENNNNTAKPTLAWYAAAHLGGDDVSAKPSPPVRANTGWTSHPACEQIRSMKSRSGSLWADVFSSRTHLRIPRTDQNINLPEPDRDENGPGLSTA